MSAKGTGYVSGVNEVLTAFRLLDAGLQARLRGAVAETTADVRDGAMARVPVSGPNARKAKGRPGPGELRNTIRAEYSADGFAGFVKAGYGKLRRSARARSPQSGAQARRRRPTRRPASLSSRGLGNYAMVVEFGSPREGKDAKPYMRPARQAAAPRHEARLQEAINGAVDAAGGSS